MSQQTTLLGVTYNGLPMFGSLALTLVHLEERDGPEAAQRMLDAHNHIRTCFGNPPIDLAQQFTDNPMSMATRSPKALAKVEADAGFEPRAIDRIVERTVRRAA